MNRCSRWQLVTGGSSISYQWSTMPPWLRCTSLADAVLNYNYSMKAVDLGDKILKSYEMNRKTLLWTTKLVFYLANMAMMNGYLLMCRSQQAVREGIIMQGHVQNLPHLREDLKLHNHFTFRVNVILALVEEGNRDHSFHNPYVRVLAVAPEWRFNECHFPEEIIPTKERAKNYHRCNGCYTEKGGGGSTPNFNVACARNSCAPGRALRCITPKASCMWTQSRHRMTNWRGRWGRRRAWKTQSLGEIWICLNSMRLFDSLTTAWFYLLRWNRRNGPSEVLHSLPLLVII